MSKVQITGRVVAGQQPFSTGNFRKQGIIVETVNGTYVSNFLVEFHNADVDTFINSGQVQPNQHYTFDCWVQGSNQVFTDKHGQPTAYVSLKCVGVQPAQATLPPTAHATAPQSGFGQPAQPAFGQQNGGFMGNPAPANTATPAQNATPFGAPSNPAPQQSSPFGQNNGGFGQPQ